MSGQGFLSRMAVASRARVRAAREHVSEGELARRARALAAPPPLRLGTFDVIAEFKLRSPAAGGLVADAFDAEAQISAYAAGGACAVSVLTEPEEFKGSLQDLERAAERLTGAGIPVMRKDFLTDPYQVLESRAAGAGGVLLIIRMLESPVLQELLDCAAESGLFILLEAFDAADLERIGELSLTGNSAPVLAGVNCRDLKSLQVDFARFAELADALPPSLPAVAESGIGSSDDLAAVASCGYRLALVGSSLMKSDAPSATLATMIARGRLAIENRRCS